MSLPATEPDTPVSTRQSRRGWLVATGWAFTTAFCGSGAWAGVLIAAREFFEIVFPPIKIDADLTLVLVGLGTVLGLLAGTGLAFRSKSGDRGAAVATLGICGALFGASILVAPAVGNRLPPLVSSSLGVAAVGFLAGLGGYGFSRWTKTRAADEFEFLEDDDPPTGAKVEWLLREEKRSWQLDHSLLRVLPVLLATALVLIVAAILAPSDVSLALLAVVALGLSVSFVLYRQEERMEALERRLREKRK